MRAEPLEARHLAVFHPSAEDEAALEEQGGLPAFCAARAAIGPAYAFVDGRHVLALGGIAGLRPRVGEAWLLPARAMQDRTLAAARIAHAWLGAMDRELGLRRLQATVRASDGRARRFAEWLGFEAEGVLRAFGRRGEDFIIYARVR